MEKDRASFMEIRKTFDGVVSIPIRTKSQQRDFKEYLLKLLDSKYIIKCFRDTKGYITVAIRKNPRLEDLFNSK